MDEDKHWNEVMELARKHGFIVQAYGGVATLATHAVQKENFSEEKYQIMQSAHKGGD